MADFTVKRGDVGKTITGQFLNADNSPINCTGNTSRKFFMRKRKASGGIGDVKINGATFSFSNEATGQFSYVFTQPNLDTPGDYLAEFEVTLPGGVVVTIPTKDDKTQTYITIQVQNDLG